MTQRVSFSLLQLIRRSTNSIKYLFCFHRETHKKSIQSQLVVPAIATNCHHQSSCDVTRGGEVKIVPSRLALKIIHVWNRDNLLARKMFPTLASLEMRFNSQKPRVGGLKGKWKMRESEKALINRVQITHFRIFHRATPKQLKVSLLSEPIWFPSSAALSLLTFVMLSK